MIEEVYILDKNGDILTPTKRIKHINKLLQTNQATVINNNPFIVKLAYNAHETEQSILKKIEKFKKGMKDEAVLGRKITIYHEAFTRAISGVIDYLGIYFVVMIVMKLIIFWSN